MPLISITGAGGNMGSATVEYLLQDPDNRLRLFLRRTKAKKRVYTRLKKQYGDRIECVYGDLQEFDKCKKLCKGADYLIHIAALIPPMADHNEKLTFETNCVGTDNMIRAVIETGNRAKFIYISSIAIYGNRDEKHPWGRVGDPLMTSAFDVYGQSKTIAEYTVLESNLKCFVVLRQTGILYDNILLNNIKDGLMFHTPWNTPIEWVTASDSARLLGNVIRSDQLGKTQDFWKKVYNIGGGAATRQTGYDIFNDGFKLIGGSVEDFFEPNWNLPRNFHCFWITDSDELEKRFHFRKESCADFWKCYSKKHFIYGGGKIVPPKILRKFIIESLHKDENAPMYWYEHNDRARIQAFFGGEKAYNELPKRWEEMKLFRKSTDYNDILNNPDYKKLDHGYDESKKDVDLTLDDMKQAATFRGGKCISKKMKTGDLYSKLRWQCHDGHEFEASPYTILKAGHWCPTCCQTPLEWNMDVVAKHSPFHAQVWNDTHSDDERYKYYMQDGKTGMEKCQD